MQTSEAHHAFSEGKAEGGRIVPSLSECLFAAVDLETTGLYASKDAIVEIGAVTFYPGSVVGRFETFVDPRRPIPAEAMAVHGITDAMVAGAPSLPEALGRLRAFLGEALLVIHNAPFDLSFLATADPSWVPWPSGVVDSCLLARKALPGRGSYGLAGLVAELGLDVSASHRALADADGARQLFCRCLAALKETAKGPDDLLALAGFDFDAATSAVDGEIRRLVVEALEAGREIVITYRDAWGRRTERSVLPEGLSGWPVPQLEAHCRLRRGKRHFRLDRILSIRPVSDN